MRNRLYIVIMLLCSTVIMCAQTSDAPALPSKVKAKLPLILDGTKLPQIDALYDNFHSGDNSNWGQGKNKTVNKYWIAYSDRENNQTYMTSDPDGDECTTLHFGEQVYIAEIQGDMALVFTENGRASFPAIAPRAISKGWVPLDNLLLWNKCPTDTRGVQLKALIAINLNEVSEHSQLRNKRLKNPEELLKAADLAMDMNFYYIMKETPNQEWALLCTGAVFSQNTLYGWVHKTAYTVWNQRTCLEPNWNPNYVENHKGQSVYVYDDESQTQKVTQWEFGKTNGVDDNGFTRYRMKPNLLRYPVLDKRNEATGMIHCTAFADKTKSGNSLDGFSTIADSVNEVRRRMRQINIILAIEATTSTSKYMPAIRDALETCQGYTSQGFEVQVGLVLYNNQTAGITPNDIVTLRNYDDAELMGKLQESIANKRLSGEKNVSLFQAIETATNGAKMGFMPGQSNLLLVIGYHGPMEDKTERERLQNILFDNRIQLSSIHLMRSGGGSSSDRLLTQMDTLVMENINNQYKAIGAEARFKRVPSKKDIGSYFKGYRKGQDASTLFAYQLYNDVIDTEMSPDVLKKHVMNIMLKFSETIDISCSTFEESLANTDFYPEFLKDKLGEKGYEAWKQIKAISAYSGYAYINSLDNNDEWRSIIYLSEDELKTLIRNLEDVSEAAASDNSDRTVYINAMKELLKRQLGGSISDQDIQEMSPEELETAIYGIVNLPTENMNMRFTKYSIKDIMNRKKVNDIEYQDILSRFNKKYERLKKEINDSRFCLEVGNGRGVTTRYYWIPLEDLP